MAGNSSTERKLLFWNCKFFNYLWGSCVGCWRLWHWLTYLLSMVQFDLPSFVDCAYYTHDNLKAHDAINGYVLTSLRYVKRRTVIQGCVTEGSFSPT